MAVLEQVTDQITDATDKFLDAAESANKRAHGATKDLVARIEKGDIPFADRFPDVKLPDVKLPLVDKLPEPQEAVDAYFGFWSKGIDVAKKATPSKATPKKTIAKKKTPAKK